MILKMEISVMTLKIENAGSNETGQFHICKKTTIKK